MRRRPTRPVPRLVGWLLAAGATLAGVAGHAGPRRGEPAEAGATRGGFAAPRISAGVTALGAPLPSRLRTCSAGRATDKFQRMAEAAGDPAGAGSLAAQAELALRAGAWAESEGCAETAAAWYLAAAERSYRALARVMDGAGDEAGKERSGVLESYATATASYLHLHAGVRGGLAAHFRATPAADVVVTLDGDFDPGEIVELVAPGHASFPPRGERVTRLGVGAPLVLVSRGSRSAPAAAREDAAEILRDATAVLHFGAAGGLVQARLELHDPRRQHTVRVAGTRLPLGADFTAALDLRAERARFVQGFFRPERALEASGIQLLEPYDPERTPLLMIHGLRSTPRIWLELTREIYGDPELRRRFQIWHYAYPSALPYLPAARLLRRDLAELERRVAATTGARLDERGIVVIGHSMGGLVAKALATGSGERLWNRVFEARPERLQGDAEDLRRLRELLVFEPSPLVRRLILLATPHRGSGLANSPIGQLGAGLAGRVAQFAGPMRRVATENAELVRPAMLGSLRQGGAKSIGALAPEHPLLDAFAELRIPVPHHSIIGVRGHELDDGASDGVVPYASAHLGTASSETVIQSAHASYDHPLAIAEVKRILREHGGGTPHRELAPQRAAASPSAVTAAFVRLAAAP